MPKIDEYLDLTGLTYYHNRISQEFASQADLDTLQEEVDELITEGGEPNVIEVVQQNGTALPVSNKTVNVTVPTALSQLTNDGDGTQGSAYATEDYVDENGGKIDTISVNGTPQTITNKNVNITVPTNVSDLTNDAGYQDATEVQDLIDDALADITTLDYEVVQTLPQTGEKGIIYLVPNSGSGGNSYDEYIWTNNAFEKIGTTDVDLSQYWGKSELVAITTAEIDTIVGA